MTNSTDVQLTHDEIWDDSALIDSWNDALEEYKKYHSIAAKGGSVEDVLAQEAEEAEAKKSIAAEATEVKIEPTPANSEPPSSAPQTTGPPAPPVQVMLGSIKDENMKKLLMSWYYAGYYTGLYEGQQQAGQPN